MARKKLTASLPEENALPSAESFLVPLTLKAESLLGNEEVTYSSSEESSGDVAVPNQEGDTDSEALVVPPEDRLPTVPQLCVAICILIVVLGYPTVMQFVGHPEGASAKTAVQEATSTDPLPPIEKIDPFANISLGADAAYVWDVAAQKALYKKNPQGQLPLASLTKLMTALVAFETYGLDSTIPITLEAIMQEGENGFKDGDAWKSKDLLDFTLMTSSNDGAFALAAAAEGGRSPGSNISNESFVQRMNNRAEEIGLTQTYFTNPTGLDASELQSGSYGSARDVAFLMEYILEHAPEILAHTTEASAEFTDVHGTTFVATNTNDTIASLTSPLGSKTGYTDLAGGNLVVAFNVGLNHPIVISVLGSSREGRFEDVELLRERVLQSFSETP